MPWEKGRSGNPHGRPRKGKTLTEILARQGRKRDVPGPDGKSISRKEALATKLWTLALEGNVAAGKYIYDRIDGQPGQSVEIKGNIKLPEVVGFYPEDYDKRTPEDPTADSELEEV